MWKFARSNLLDGHSLHLLYKHMEVAREAILFFNVTAVPGFVENKRVLL